MNGKKDRGPGRRHIPDFDGDEPEQPPRLRGIVVWMVILAAAGLIVYIGHNSQKKKANLPVSQFLVDLERKFLELF